MRLLMWRLPLNVLLLAGLLRACPLHGQAQELEELLQRATAAQSSGNYADAAAIYARACALSPATPELWSNQGVMQYLAGQVDASTTSLKHALRLNPNLFTPILFLGKAYVQTGKPALALPYLNHAHALQPNDIETVLALGKANADLNRHRQAEFSYADAARLAPENPAAWFGLGVASLQIINADGRALAASQAQSIWARALYADELLTQGRPLEAMDNYKLALASASPAQMDTLASMVEWSKDHPELFPLPPNSQAALQELAAQLQPGQGNAGLRQCPSSAPPIDDAACAFWAGNYEDSAGRAAQLLDKSAQDAEGLYWSIKANERIAVAALSRFEDLSPQSAASYVMVGDLYRHQRLLDDALNEYKKALAIDPHDPPALIGAAVADLSSGKLEEATAMDQTALAARPLDPELNLLMAEVLAAENQYEQARVYLAKCVTGPPELQTRAHYLLGRANMEEGKTQEAIHQFEIALPGDKDGSAHYQLSRLYRKAGRVTEAERAEAEAKVLIQQRDSNAVIAVREAIGTHP